MTEIVWCHSKAGVVFIFNSKWSIFSTTDKTWKELVEGEKCSYKCWHFPAKMSCLRSFCRENGICALWWSGLTQKVNVGQVRWYWGRGREQCNSWERTKKEVLGPLAATAESAGEGSTTGVTRKKLVDVWLELENTISFGETSSDDSSLHPSPFITRYFYPSPSITL